MLIDTHCHINILAHLYTQGKAIFDVPLTTDDLVAAQQITKEALDAGIAYIINVGTSVIESHNCILIAQNCVNNFAVVGIHPNDCTSTWTKDIKVIEQQLQNKEKNKIVGIGECGLDYHYPDHNKKRQRDAFKTHIELALENNLPLVIHTRDAGDETLECLEEFKNEPLKGVFHCFSENQTFADYAINKLQFLLGIGGAVTYPNNNNLRKIVSTFGLNHLILETDAPYLAPQIVRGQRNHPKYIRAIAQYISTFLHQDIDIIASKTTKNAMHLFNLPIME